MQPVTLNHDQEPVTTSSEVAAVIMEATDTQIGEKKLSNEEAAADFQLSTDALNYHRVEWRLREELDDVPTVLLERVDPGQIDRGERMEAVGARRPNAQFEIHLRGDAHVDRRCPRR